MGIYSVPLRHIFSKFADKSNPISESVLIAPNAASVRALDGDIVVTSEAAATNGCLKVAAETAGRCRSRRV